MARMRKPFEGVWNVVRFNWHFYLFALLFLSALLALGFFVESVKTYALIFFFLALAATVISLVATYYVYDLSGLYDLLWLNDYKPSEKQKIVNINAGFDETSELLERRFPNAELAVFDFYDSEKHTEVSIKRARRAYPPHPHTERIETSKLPLADQSTDKVLAILSAHEIRNPEERNVFFCELNRILKPDGRLFVTEHLRDVPNFLAYNIGFFHFHSRAAWLENFQNAGFTVEKKVKITPFITTFILKKL